MKRIQVLILLLIANYLISQNQRFEHEIKFPVIGHLESNLFSEFALNYQNNFFKHIHKPSFEYIVSYNKKLYAGIGYQDLYISQFNGIETRFLPLGSLGSTYIDQFYFKLGFQKNLLNRLNFRIGVILVNNKNTSNSFLCDLPLPWEGIIGGTTYKRYALGPDVSISYKIYKGFFIELNSNFTISKLVDAYCGDEYHYGKFTLLHSNIKVGYKF